MNTHKLAPLTMNDEGFMFDPTTGDSFVVNATAIAILHSLQDGRSESEIVQQLVERFEVTPDTALRDVAEFLSRLKALQLT
jgi:PqqD family protein of HPr-rel-A system